MDEDAYRIELVRGHVVREPRPATYHGLVATRIARYLEEHVESRQLGVVIGDAGFVLEETPPSVRGPDVAFLSAGRIPANAPRRTGVLRTVAAGEVLTGAPLLPDLRIRVAALFRLP